MKFDQIFLVIIAAYDTFYNTYIFYRSKVVDLVIEISIGSWQLAPGRLSNENKKNGMNCLQSLGI